MWKDPQHPFRTDESLQVTGIPTLVQWTSEGPGQRISTDLERASSPADAEAIAQAFIAKTDLPAAHSNGAN